MFGKPFVRELISRSAENEADRRRFLRSASVAGLGLVGAGLVGTAALETAAPALASTSQKDSSEIGDGDDGVISDAAILNFALNLEYLEAEFYSYATSGHGLASSLIHGRGRLGPVVGGRQVPFRSRTVQQYAEEIARDEHEHVAFLRAALGSAKVARPKINIQYSFTQAARAAGLVGPKDTFDPYANENNFLLAAYIFEDVGVTAYKGAAPLISNKTYLGAAAGILAVEAYHAANVRTVLFERGLCFDTNKISAARNFLDSKSGAGHRDQGTIRHGKANIVPADSNGLAFGRTPGQVLNIVYLNPDSVRRGGFFPAGVNGALNTSG
jgi:Ferritin-like domain